MKKIKLLPILCGCATIAAATPIVASCSVLSQDVYDYALDLFRNIALKKIQSTANEAVARQPEAKDRIFACERFLLESTWKCTYWAQAWAFKNEAAAVDCIARQPEQWELITYLVIFSCQVIYSQPNEKSLAIGSSTPYEAIGRQPEMAPILAAQYVEYCYEVINGGMINE